MPSPFAPFRHRVFAAFWFGAFVSNIGTWMETVGIGIYVTSATGRSGWTGLVAAAGFAPGAILGPVGGALADRLPRKALLITTTSVQTALATVLTVLAATGSPSPGLVTLIVLASGCAQAIGFPTYQSLLPDLVPPEDLVGAVALSSAQWNLGRVLGPALAAVVIGIGGYAWAFGINAVSFLAVIAAVIMLTLPPPQPHHGQTIRVAIGQGVAYVRRDPGLRVVMGYMFINTFLAAPFIALVPAMSLIVLHAGKTGTGILITSQGVGAVVMALSLANLAERFGSRRVLLMSLWGLPPVLAIYSVMPNLWSSAAALFFVGLIYFGALSSFMSIAQIRAPAAIRGRVVSLLAVVLGSLYPLGAVIQGAVADGIGLRETTLIAAGLMLVALVAMKLRNPRFADAL
ncbi:MAG: MFS transporter, partial [Acidimicrobiia bacterium]|nr:MFS transporter [Acidimicrobiia bacterium]